MRYRIVNSLRLVMLVVCLAGLLGGGSPAEAAAWQDDEPRILRVYSLADLLATEPRFANPATAWPGTGLFTPSADSSTGSGGMGGGGMGGGMGGGGVGGGGGLFAVPSGRPPMGGMVGGMSAVAGMGESAETRGGSQDFSGPIFGGSFSGSPGTPLLALLHNLLADERGFSEDGWEIYGGLLVARQTREIHALTAEILAGLRAGLAEQQIIHIEWVALSLDAADIATFFRQVDDPQLLEALILQRAAAYGTLSALNGHLVYSTSGEHRNLVIGVTPVVGTFQDGLGSSPRGVGYQPQSVKPILGWVAQVRPLIPADPTQPGLLHVGISRAKASDETRGVPVIGGPDRGNVPAFQAVGTVKCLPDTWTVVGGLATNAAVEGNDPSPKHIVMVRWKR
jgi:hypothetical protein